MGPLVPAPTFILNVIINIQKQIVDGFAGHPMEAHRAAVADARGIFLTSILSIVVHCVCSDTGSE